MTILRKPHQQPRGPGIAPLRLIPENNPLVFEQCRPYRCRLTKGACAARWELAQDKSVDTVDLTFCRGCDVGERNAREYL